MFQNECVGELAYESTAPAISMAAALITFMLDFVGSRIAHKKYSGHALESPSIDDHGESGSVERKGREAAHPAHHDSHGHNFDAALAAEQNHQVLLLEAGIIFHSIMIGVTLVRLSSFAQLTFRELARVQDGSPCSSSSSFTKCLKVLRKFVACAHLTL
jgi:zinc transporter 1/2/3